MSEHDEELSTLSESCPFWGGNPSHCQFHELRKMTYLDKLLHLANLSDVEKSEMIHCHFACLSKQEAAVLTKNKR